MATKPTSTPTWATDAGATVEPNTAKKAAGWANGERPPPKFFNWWQNLAWQWLDWLDDITEDIQTTYPATAGINFEGFALNVDLAAETTGATKMWLIPLTEPIGYSITALATRAKNDGTADEARVSIKRLADTVASMEDLGGIDLPNSAAYASYSTSITPHTIAAGWRYYIAFETTVAWSGTFAALDGAITMSIP